MQEQRSRQLDYELSFSCHLYYYKGSTLLVFLLAVEQDTYVDLTINSKIVLIQCP